MTVLKTDFDFMRCAIEQAAKASSEGEVPVGAVVVFGSEVIATGRNEKEKNNDPTAHAEMLAIKAATEVVGDWRLSECTLYVTLEPCPMCAGAILASRIPRVVYGAADPKAGAVDSLFGLLRDHRLNHQVEVRSGVLAEESSRLLKSFFGKRRQQISERCESG